jgi:hypothetical protein
MWHLYRFWPTGNVFWPSGFDPYSVIKTLTPGVRNAGSVPPYPQVKDSSFHHSRQCSRGHRCIATSSSSSHRMSHKWTQYHLCDNNLGTTKFYNYCLGITWHTHGSNTRVGNWMGNTWKQKENTYTFSVLQNEKWTPAYLSNLISARAGTFSNYNTRGAHTISIPAARTNLYQSSFLPSTVKLWNELLPEVRNAPTLETFKNSLTRNILNIPPHYNLNIAYWQKATSNSARPAANAM